MLWNSKLVDSWGESLENLGMFLGVYVCWLAGMSPPLVRIERSFRSR